MLPLIRFTTQKRLQQELDSIQVKLMKKERAYARQAEQLSSVQAKHKKDRQVLPY